MNPNCYTTLTQYGVLISIKRSKKDSRNYYQSTRSPIRFLNEELTGSTYRSNNNNIFLFHLLYCTDIER